MAKEPRVKEVPSGGTGGKILAFILGLLMGIILIVGALGGAAYYVYKSPIQDTVKLIDGGKENGKIYKLLFGDDGEGGYLDGSYANKKVGELLKDTTAAAKAISQNGALSDLETLSPKVRTTLQKLLDKTDDYDIPLDENELMNKPVKELGKYVLGQIKEASLGGLLKGLNDGKETDDSLLLLLCYGEEDIDYKWENGEIVMLGESKKTTVDQIVTDGFDGMFDKITLDAMDIDPDDAIMRTLAYGPASHYDPVKEGTKVVDVKMKQIQFTWNSETREMLDIDGEVVADIDNAEIGGTFVTTDGGAKGVLTLKEGETYYLSTTPATPLTPTPPANTYFAYKSAEDPTAKLYEKTKISELTENAPSLIDGLYLSDTLNINNSAHQVLISLAYGSKENYDVEDDGTITLKPGVKPRTIGDLKTKNQDLIDEILLADALGIDDNSHPVLKAIAVDRETNKNRTLGELSAHSDTIINGIYLADALSVTPDTHPILKSILCSGTYGVDYDIVQDGAKVDSNGNPVYVIQANPGKTITLHTLGKLSEDSESLINGILLSDALGVKDDDSSHPVLRSLTFKEDGTSRTLGEFTEDSGKLIDGITLDTVLSSDGSSLTSYLLHGKENIHYVKSGESITYLQKRFLWSATKQALYNEYGELLQANVTSAPDSFTVGTGEDAVTYYLKVSSPLETQNIKVKTTKEVGGVLTTTNVESIDAQVLYAYEDNTFAEDKKVMYAPTTIGDLKGDLVNNLTKRLTVGELIGDEDHDNLFLKHLTDETFDTLPFAIEHLSIAKVYAHEVYANGVDGTLKGTWKYLLTDPSGSMAPEAYTLNDFSAMVDNMTQNITSTSLYDLRTDGIIDKDTADDTMLETELSKFEPIEYRPPERLNEISNPHIGHLTVNELFNLVSKLISLVPST